MPKAMDLHILSSKSVQCYTSRYKICKFFIFSETDGVKIETNADAEAKKLSP